MTIALTTPEQIGMWVLLSRRHQLQLQMKGYKKPGLVKWCQQNIEGAGRTARACVVPVEYAIAQAGGQVDYKLVNIHVMEIVRPNEVFQDMGIYNSPDDIDEDSHLGRLYKAGRAEVVLTLDDPRPPNGNLFSPA